MSIELWMIAVLSCINNIDFENVYYKFYLISIHFSHLFTYINDLLEQAF